MRSDAEVRSNVFKSLLVNVVSLASVYFFDLMLLPLTREHEYWLRRNVGWFYQTLWLFPVVGISLYLNVSNPHSFSLDNIIDNEHTEHLVYRTCQARVFTPAWLACRCRATIDIYWHPQFYSVLGIPYRDVIHVACRLLLAAFDSLRWANAWFCVHVLGRRVSVHYAYLRSGHVVRQLDALVIMQVLLL